MNYKYLGCFCVLLLVMTGSHSCKCNGKQTGGNNGGNSSVYLYTFEKHEPLSEDNAKKNISDYLGVANVPNLTLNKDENTVYYVSDADVNTTFEQNLTTGSFEFSKLTKAYNNLVPQLPSHEAAVKIAEDYLRSKNIFPKNAGEFRLVHNGGVRSQAVVNGQQAGPIVDKLISLSYGRILDSMPVIGSGSKLIVNIGDKGEILGVTKRWRELNTEEKKEVKAEEMISREEAEEQARKQISEEFGRASFDIKSATKSYYDNNGNYLQPVWAFNTVVNITVRDSTKEQVKYLCVIPMLKNSPEPLRLTAMDPRAKESIKNIDAVRDTTRTRNKDND